MTTKLLHVPALSILLLKNYAIDCIRQSKVFSFTKLNYLYLCKYNNKLIKEFKKGDLEIVMATMNRDSLDFLIPIFPFCHFSEFSILIINQTLENKLLVSDFPSIRVVNSFEKGLSKSRNLGLQNAKGKIILIADDDEIFKEDFESSILEAHNNYPEAASICFAIEDSNGFLFKKYPSQTKLQLNNLDIFNILSIEISLKKTVLNQLNSKFDTNFGLGSPFMMGEEAIFLSDWKKQNKSIIIVPKLITSHPSISTDDKLNFEQRYYIQGAFLTRVSNDGYFKGVFMKLFFDIKQNKIKINQVFAALKSANKGKEAFLQITK
ncbi:glycosyltransferase family 2 protein [Flavobacterium rhamnosiphilum]|uniref:Glycosyltransferase family 2 protein n=1 Tax=Flavobacterium rhamnosiphilum TaxID=2541724 RepID=A0A4R5F471_9FLAO|nr:glycosyltransferase family A protein [Flavobacterium rhamnosiphilum]TDE42263.1 glycosyltransferase family 2 protein [Flavobacterium rhamnosiphilum]